VTRRSSLTGSWSGAYRYRGSSRETVFNAQIEEQGSFFFGAIQEPNTFAPAAQAVLSADIEGSRSGQSVTFTKHYNHESIRHAIRYEGQADGALMRIEGTWTIPPLTSGTFFMVRDDEGEHAEAKEAVEEPVEGRK
jgi:hypothetical protein